MIFTSCFMAIFSKVNAASAEISSNKTNATVGDDVTVTVTINAATWNLTVSGSGVNTTKYVDTTDDANNATTKKTLKIDTSTAGDKTINLTGDISDGSTGETSKINKSLTIKVNAKSTNNNSGNASNNNKGNSSNTSNRYKK